MKTNLESKMAQLEQLAQEIRAEMAKVGAAFRKALEHARRILPDDHRDDIRRVDVFRTRPDRERRERPLEFGGPTRMAGLAIEQDRPSLSARAHGVLARNTQRRLSAIR